MSDPTPEPEQQPTARVSPAAVGSVLELLALVLITAAAFAAPTDWNVTLGLAVLAGALFVLGFFALAGTEA